MNQQGHGGGGRAAVSVIFGVVGVAVGVSAAFIPMGGGITAFILGIIAIAVAAGSRRRGGGGLAVFGLILGIIAVLLGLRGILVCAGILSCAGLACAALA